MPPPPRLAQISSTWSREGSGVYRDGRGFGHYRDPKTGNLVISSPWQTRRRSLAQTTESPCDSNPMSYECYLFSMEYLYGPDAHWLGLAQIEAEESGDLNDCSDMCDE